MKAAHKTKNWRETLHGGLLAAKNAAAEMSEGKYEGNRSS